MKVKPLILILTLVLLISVNLRGDVFPPYKTGGLAGSLEILGSYEIGFSSRTSLLVWGGWAGIVSIEQVVYIPILPFNTGPEAALELRRYFREKENKKWAFSIYAGTAYNLRYDRYGAITPGIKLTRKKTINRLLQLEPYISLSYPFYYDGGHAFIPYLTFGYRIVLEKRKAHTP